MLNKRFYINLFYIGLGFCAQPLFAKDEKTTTTFVRGALEGKGDINLHGYSVFFDGRSIKTDKSGNFQIKTDIDLSKDTIESLSQDPLFILISSGVEWKKEPKTKTIKSACQNPAKPYKCYQIKAISNGPDKEPSLVATDKDLKENNWQIPIERCVIFPINSFLIQDIKMPHKLFQGNIFQLPKLVLQDEKPLKEHKSKTLLSKGFDKDTHDYRTKNVIPRGRDKGVIRSLDYKPFHEDTVFYVKKTKNALKKPVEITFYEQS